MVWILFFVRTTVAKPAMIAMLLVLLVSVGNFAVGFALAIHFGHGPGWAFPKADSIRDRLRNLLGLSGNAERKPH